MSKTELKTAIAKYSNQSGEILTDQELTESSDDLLSFFALLIEADKDLMKTNEPRNYGNPDHTN